MLTNPPWWTTYLEGGTADTLGVSLGFSASAVLFIDMSGRRFAFTFGHRYSMLAPGSWEPDFGLRVTLNAVDPDKLRTVDVHTVEELTLHTSRQASRASPITIFGIDASRDLLRAVRGQPRDESVARRLGGADGLRFDAYVELPELGLKCEQLLALSEDDVYKENFAWIDHLRPVSDPQTVARLDEQMLAAAFGDRARQPHLAPPEPLEWDSIEGFSYSVNPTVMSGEDLDLDEYLLLKGDTAGLAVDELKQDRVLEWRVGAGQGEEHWSVYDCVVFESDHEGARYVLTRGRWFRVDLAFAANVRKRVAAIKRAAVPLPDAHMGESEFDYNKRAAKACGLALLDKKTGAPAGGRGQIEFCDLLSSNGDLIHVKRWSRSATLSHLFAQGTVSAETLLGDRSFRRKLRTRIAKLPGFEDVVPVDAPDRSHIRVVYCVIGKSGATELPFFSQLAMSQAARHLDLLGVAVSARFVPLS